MAGFLGAFKETTTTKRFHHYATRARLNLTQHIVRLRSNITMTPLKTLIVATFLVASLAQSDPTVAINGTSYTPTIHEMAAFYPGMVFHNLQSDVQARRPSRIASREPGRYAYKFFAGSFLAAGYYSVGPGATQVADAIEACQDDKGKLYCINRALSAALAHALVFGTGFHGGKDTVHFMWNGLAQVAGATAAVGAAPRIKRACNTGPVNWPISTHFAGNAAMKVTSKDVSCGKTSLSNDFVDGLASQIASGLNSPAHFALDTQFTIVEQATGNVMGRFHVQLSNTRTDTCPAAVEGTGCHVDVTKP